MRSWRFRLRILPPANFRETLGHLIEPLFCGVSVRAYGENIAFWCVKKGIDVKYHDEQKDLLGTRSLAQRKTLKHVEEKKRKNKQISHFLSIALQFTHFAMSKRRVTRVWLRHMRQLNADFAAFQ